MMLRMVCVAWAVLAAAGWVRGEELSLLLSTSGDAATLSGAFPDIDDEEILVFSPPLSGEPSSFLEDWAWEAVRGDVDGNGRFDDEPGEVDALHVPVGSATRPTVYDLYLSFSATESFLGEVSVEDGDIVRVLPGGGAEIVLEEAFFEVATGTDGVDVDAFTVSAAGDVFFSFADSEETTYPSIIEENGGASTLEDGTILVVRSGEMLAHVFATEAQVLEMVRQALGVSNSSIGDTQGLAEDPAHPGDLWFVVSSTALGIEGTVFSTYEGGSVAVLNGGTELHGATIGFETEEALDALALVPWTKDPLTIQVDSADISQGNASEIEIRVRNGVPGGYVRIVASPAVLPVLAPVPDPRLSGVGLFFVDTGSELFRNSSIRDKYLVQLDPDGTGSFRYPSRPVPPGVQRILQVVDLDTLEISDAVILEAVPAR
jgi:hypothetical protein